MESMENISTQVAAQLLSEARTYSYFLPQEVDDTLLHQMYDLMKMGPTSANTCPARIAFVKAGPAKEKLLACASPGNVDKIKSAPITAVIATDSRFYDFIPKLFPMNPGLRDVFANDAPMAQTASLRNGSLQGGYLIMAARMLGLDCGPMSGFDNAKLDAALFEGSSWKSNFICNVGYGDRSKVFPRLPRLTFEEACKIV